MAFRLRYKTEERKIQIHLNRAVICVAVKAAGEMSNQTVAGQETRITTVASEKLTDVYTECQMKKVTSRRMPVAMIGIIVRKR